MTKDTSLEGYIRAHLPYGQACNWQKNVVLPKIIFLYRPARIINVKYRFEGESLVETLL